jgi:small multidrug resistance pump/quaternary ammonium compound-resistance protein SugE
MKWSDGVTRPGPGVAFLLLFASGAVLQALAMRTAGLGTVYIAVLGLEAALTAVFSVAVFHEPWPASRVIAVLLIAGGVVLLRVH